MQVKKFEATTMQEALDSVKRELGPEAIILQTRKNKRRFGLGSKSSVEITAAVSERSLQKKQLTETRLPEATKASVKKMDAEKQANFFDKYTDRYLERAGKTTDRVELSGGASKNAQKGAQRITATRYIDIEDVDAGGKPVRREPVETRTSRPNEIPEVLVGANVIPEAYSDTEIRKRQVLEDDVRQLKKVIEELRSQQQLPDPLAGTGVTAPSKDGFENPAIQSAFEHLTLNGVDRRPALNLIRKVNFDLGPDQSKNPEKVMDALLEQMLENIKVESLFDSPADRKQGETSNRPMVVALVGSTGVGKTAMVAKIAGDALLKRNLKVGLINLDQIKNTAFDQLATYAKILKVPFRSAASVQDLKSALSDFHSLDLVLIDTAGRSHRDPVALKETHEILGSVPGLVSCLVVSATTRDTELYETASRFGVFEPKGLIVSKLDEAVVFGSIYNLSQKTQLPLLYFSTGQKVPEDFEVATGERVVALVLDI